MQILFVKPITGAFLHLNINISITTPIQRLRDRIVLANMHYSILPSALLGASFVVAVRSILVTKIQVQ